MLTKLSVTLQANLSAASYDNQDIALNCGMILRECIRHEALGKQVLESPSFWRFFQFVELSTFDVASDAFATFKVRRTAGHLAVYIPLLTIGM
jgi:hypothetical protein